MREPKLELDKSLLKKARKEGKALLEEVVAEQQEVMGQETEGLEEKKKEKKAKKIKEKKVKEPKEKKVDFAKLKEVFRFKGKKTPKEVKEGKFSTLHSMQTKVMVLVAVGIVVLLNHGTNLH